MRYTCKSLGEQWIEPRWEEAWFPDAFVGPMAELLVALETGAEPDLGGRGNLGTLALVEACTRGALEHRVVALDEVRGAAAGDPRQGKDREA